MQPRKSLHPAVALVSTPATKLMKHPAIALVSTPATKLMIHHAVARVSAPATKMATRIFKRIAEIIIALSLTALLLSFSTAAYSQNVGISTNTPTKKLSVAGSIAVDHNNANIGTLDSAALVFGTGPSLAGIFSKKTAGLGYNGLSFWTNNQHRMLIAENGTVAINTSNPDQSYDFYVAGDARAHTFSSNSLSTSNAYISQEANVTSRVNINGNEHTGAHRLTVNDGDSYFDGDGEFNGYLVVDGSLNANSNISASQDIYSFTQVRSPAVRATNNMAVGGTIDPLYRLRVWDGNSRFGGDVQVTGTLNAGEVTTQTINGTGVMRSNGPSSLLMGFNAASMNLNMAGGSQTDLTVSITDFEGNNNDVRVFVSQFDPDPLPQYANWHDFSFHIHSVDDVNDTCKIRITNTTDGSLWIKGTLYITSVAKE